MTAVKVPKPTRTLPVAQPGFRYDTSRILWKDYLSEGCYYRVLHVDIAAGTAEMLVKFDPHKQCLWHRHRSVVATHVLEGEQRIVDRTDGHEEVRIKPAGSFSVGALGEIHIEGGGEEGALIFFSMRSTDGAIYDLLDQNLSLKREVTVSDFDWEWRDSWPEDHALRR
jgi:hypothetical protein